MVEPNEQTNKGVDTGKKPDTISETDKPVSIVDEARSIRDEIKQEREKLEAANKEQATLQADAMLGSNAGGHIEKNEKKENDHDYRVRIQKEMAEGKTEFGT